MVFQKRLINFSALLIVILPVFLFTGPFLPDASIIIISLFYLFFLKGDFKSQLSKNFFLFYFISIFIYLIFNSLFSYDVSASLATSLKFIRIILFIFGLSFFLKKNEKLYSYFFYSFIVCISILFIDSIFELINGHNLLGFKSSDASRISSFFGKRLILGSYVARLVPLIIGISFLFDNKNIEKYRLYILLISLILILLSAERLALIYFISFIIFYIFLDFKKYYFKYLFIILTIVLTFFYFFSNASFKRLTTHSFNQYKQTKSFLSPSYRHHTHYLTAYKMFEDKKIIGHGVNSFRYLCNLNPYSVEEDIKRDHVVLSPFAGLLVYNIISESKFYLTVTSLEGEKFGGTFERNNYLNFYSPSGFNINKNQPLFSSYEYINGCNTHPHNIYLQFLAELGIAGFLLFSVIFIYICLQLLKYSYKRINKQITYKEKCLSFILFGTFMALFPLLPSGNFFNNWLMIITFLPVGFYISIFSKKNG